MKGLIVVVSLFIYYSSASVLVKEDAEDELLSREKREVSYWAENKPDTLDGCDAGEFAVEVRNENGKLTGFRCEPCAEGFFTQAAGFWKKCVPCELEHQTTPPGYNGKCYNRCDPGKGWNSTLKKCLPCDAEFYQPEDSFNECRKCPLFHNSTKADANCLLECPRGMEPTEDGTSCTQCKVGYFQKVPGRKGVNEKCVICCEPPCDPNKNWTYVVGANATNQCIKLPNPLKTCFPYLITALEKAAKYIYEDDTKETLRPLLTALCLSGADLPEMVTQIQACGVKEVTVAGVKVPAYPKLRINATLVLDMKTEVFNIHGTPECPQTTTTEPTTTESSNAGEDQASPTTDSTSSTSPITSSSSTSSTSSTTSPTDSTSSTAEPSNADEDQGSSTTGSISSTSPTPGSSSTSSTSSTNSFTDSTSSTTTAEPGNADQNQGSQTTDSTSTTPPTTSPSSTSSTSSTTSSTSSTASMSSTSSTTSSSSTSSTSSTTSTTGTSEATTASTTTTTEFFLS